ncbi:hypothetical protein GCM10028791_07670 [Echinicola sediminis]
MIAALIGFFHTVMAQEVLKLEKDEPAAMGQLEDLSWLVGYWKGTGFGGECDELWLPPQGNSMTGIFRFVEEGKLIFSEYMAIVEEEGRLYLKVKHFNGDFSPWEDKDKWVNFRFIKSEGKTAYFSGLTLHRKKSSLTLKLAMEHNGQTSVETLEYVKVKL